MMPVLGCESDLTLDEGSSIVRRELNNEKQEEYVKRSSKYSSRGVPHTFHLPLLVASDEALAVENHQLFVMV